MKNGGNKMNTKELIIKHHNCIKIIEGIETFQNLIELNKDHIRIMNGWFPDVTQKYIHKIEIYQMCIERLKERYLRTLTN